MTTKRSMSNVFTCPDGYEFEFYESTFDADTGIIVRAIEVGHADADSYSYGRSGLLKELLKQRGLTSEYEADWKERQYNIKVLTEAWEVVYGPSYNGRDEAWSPSPETIDIKVTNWCNVGCNYCYMASTKEGTHAPKDLLRNVFNGLDKAPYQIAFGGGEPTAHPDFPWFLEFTREQGTVPNYTTAGHLIRDEVIKATNDYCGGVALTYHAFKGPDWFKETYNKWKSLLSSRVQMNVHVIADKNVHTNLMDLMDSGLTDLNIVLLAYYPEVGRAGYEGIMPKSVYQHALPSVLSHVHKRGFKVAYSEGLLPYFMSMGLPEVNVEFATRQEGHFSCYVDDTGHVSHSSFEPVVSPVHYTPPSWIENDPKEISTWRDRIAEVYDEFDVSKARLQDVWNTGFRMRSSPYYDECISCHDSYKCHAPHETHYLQCARAGHNKTKSKSAYDVSSRKLIVLP